MVCPNCVRTWHVYNPESTRCKSARKVKDYCNSASLPTSYVEVVAPSQEEPLSCRELQRKPLLEPGDHLGRLSPCRCLTVELRLPTDHEGLVDGTQLDDRGWSQSSLLHPHPGHRPAAAGAGDPKAPVPSSISCRYRPNAEASLTAHGKPSLRAKEQWSSLTISKPELENWSC